MGAATIVTTQGQTVTKQIVIYINMHRNKLFAAEVYTQAFGNSNSWINLKLGIKLKSSIKRKGSWLYHNVQS